jgi:hypothetical protein
MADSDVPSLTDIGTAFTDADELYIADGGVLDKKCTLKNLLNHSPAFGGLYVASGAATQNITAAGGQTKITQFAQNSGNSKDVTEDHTNDILTPTREGYYLVGYQISFTGQNSTTYAFVPRYNGTNINMAVCRRKVGTGSDVGSCGAIGLLDVTTASQNLDLTIQNVSGSDGNVTIIDGSLWMVRLGWT